MPLDGVAPVLSRSAARPVWRQAGAQARAPGRLVARTR
ncbi:hypothetical protein SLNWT_7254 [Streptomyces albus]|uniref:Uncharacterized protein n=1 Tax=Streptomyces albus (strain ATCC 21838 / DSM 41398 / FERM P-419 / JCM 4703 / NBRC 107858) TaxID=1081613 RepID=A0A0B5F7T5_STRA4|nr:hypothetical protein SLNWT_7254 [Streptomyces albus]